MTWGVVTARGGVVVTVALAAVLSIGCLDDDLDPSRALTGDTYIAFQRDFQTFRSWRHVQVGESEIPGGHAAGPRVAYLNTVAVGGHYPLGTIIVKTVEIGDPSTWTIHARSKHGGGFNPHGAVDWEWFDLSINTAGQTIINWQGPKPPADHGYESLPGLGATSSTDGDCNTCHGAAGDADYILSPVLRAELGK